MGSPDTARHKMVQLRLTIDDLLEVVHRGDVIESYDDVVADYCSTALPAGRKCASCWSWWPQVSHSTTVCTVDRQICTHDRAHMRKP